MKTLKTTIELNDSGYSELVDVVTDITQFTWSEDEADTYEDQEELESVLKLAHEAEIKIKEGKISIEQSRDISDRWFDPDFSLDAISGWAKEILAAAE